MLQMSSVEWPYWPSLYSWPLLRVLALILTAPILSERAIPKRVKLGLGLIITVVIAPSIPTVDVPIFSTGVSWQAIQQILIGIVLGFTMQLAFVAMRTAGELIGLQMGLSFATFFDPGSHLNIPVLTRLIDIFAILLFLTSSGHSWLTPLLVDTFHTLPIGGSPANSNAFFVLARAGSLIFLNRLTLALPVMTLLFALNLASGSLNRMTPQLSVSAIGSPLALAVGISLMAVLMPSITPFCERLFSKTLSLLVDIVSEIPRR